MTRKTEVLDDDGNIIDPPPADHPVRAIIYLLEYGRLRGFRIGPLVRIGDVALQVRDTRLKEEHHQDAAPDVQPGSDMAVLFGLEE